MLEICTAVRDANGSYAKYVAAMVASVLANTKARMRFHVLTDSTLSVGSRNRICQTASQWKGFVVFYDLSESGEAMSVDEKALHRFTIATMYRLKLAEVLPGDTNRLIYLDADIIVNIDLQELWETQMENFLIGACVERLVPTERKFVCREELISGEEYINAGVILMDLGLIRKEHDLYSESIAFLRRFPEANYFDQDAINYVFRGKIKLLEDKWNSYAVEMRRQKLPEQKRIYHFIADSPRDSQAYAPDRLFLRYLRLTPWGTEAEIVSHFERRLMQKDEKMKRVSNMLRTIAESCNKRQVFWGRGRRDTYTHYETVQIAGWRLLCGQQPISVGQAFRGWNNAFACSAEGDARTGAYSCDYISISGSQIPTRSLGLSGESRLFRRQSATDRPRNGDLHRQAGQRLGCLKVEKLCSPTSRQALKISIIVPIYNAERYLQRSLDSILNQTYRNLEIILVDDGSTDGSAGIMEEYAKQDGRIIIFRQAHNMGLVRARKTGVRLATGDYISYVDADDEISLTRCEELLPQMEAGIEIIVTDVVQVYSSHSSQRMTNYFFEKNYNAEEIKAEILTRIADAGHFYKRYLRTYVWGGVFSRSLLQKCQQLVVDEVVMGEDTVCFLWCILYAKSLAVVSGAEYYYYKNVGSMCHISSFDAENCKKIRRSHVAFKKFMQDYQHHLPEGVRDIVGKQLRHTFYYLTMASDYRLLMEQRPQVTFFPFAVPVTAKVVIYGAGSFGQQLFEFWSGRKEVKILAWCDRSFEKYIAAGLEVHPPERILEVNAEYVLMAIAQYDVARIAAEDLVGMGVAQNRIRYVEADEMG